MQMKKDSSGKRGGGVFYGYIIVALAMLIMATFIQGAVVTETVFSWPGIGWLALQRAVYDNDFPLLMGCVMFFVLIYLVMALIADILYAFVDPRIRYQ